jgi:hypothetical protein
MKCKLLQIFRIEFRQKKMWNGFRDIWKIPFMALCKCQQINVAEYQNYLITFDGSILYRILTKFVKRF